MEKCPEDYIFRYDYKCYYRCPNETLPDDFICKKSFDKAIDDKGVCSIKNYFLDVCKINLLTPIEKQKFIEATVNELIDGKLFDLALMAIENKMNFIKREKNEIY